ncbi:MAG: NADPH-dependent FMN reductase [Cumulibacter sp.]
MSNPVLQVIVCSTRPTRVGKSVADWFIETARAHGGLDVEVADLAEIQLPLLDEPHHPAMQQYQHEHTKQWAQRIAGSDAYVLVTPEYNYGLPAAGKNALDYLWHEWGMKPVGFVSYGGMSAGIRAVQMFKEVVTTLRMYPMSATVSIPNVAECVSEDRITFTPTDIVTESATALLDELAKTAPVMAQLRD